MQCIGDLVRATLDDGRSFEEIIVVPPEASPLELMRATYPQIDVRLGLADRNIDIVQDGVDCVIRMGALEESSLVARRGASARANC